MNIFKRLTSSLKAQGSATVSGLSSACFSPYTTSPRYGTEQVSASYLTSPIVRDVVGKIAYSVATNRWILYSVKGKKPGSRAIRHIGAQNSGVESRWSTLRSLAQIGRLTEIEVHPVLDFLSSANSQITGFNAWRMSQLSIDLSGEMFWVLGYGKAGIPETYWPIPPQWVNSAPKELYPAKELQSIARTSIENRPKVTIDNGYQIRVGHTIQLFGQWEVIWIKDPNPLDPYGRGAGIGQTLGDEIETDEYAAKFLKTFFLNSARPEIVISVDGASTDALAAAKAGYENQFGTFWNTAKAWWTNGKTTVHELTGKIRDMQMIELRKAQRDIVGVTYGVPPEIRGITENANRATITVAEYIYLSQVIVPRLELMRSELQAKLIPLYDDRLVLDYLSPIPEDREHQLEVLKASPHVATRAEWRRMAGLVDRGDGDDVHHQASMLVETPAPKKSKRRGMAAKSIGQIELFGVLKAGETLSGEGIDNVVDALSGRTLTEYTLPTQEEQLQWWGDAQLDGLGVTGAFNMQSPVVQAFLLDFGAERVKLINDTTKRELREALLDGVQRGEGLKELSDRVSKVMGYAKDYRTDRIARDEAKRAANFGTLESFKQSGVVEKKKWVAQLLNTRDSHLVLHSGAPIGINDYFAIDNDRSQYPGGFSLPENSINCQCSLSPVLEELKAAGDRKPNEFNVEVQPWVDTLGVQFSKAFAEQEKDVMKALAENAQ